MAYLAPAGTPVTLFDIARGLAAVSDPLATTDALSAVLKNSSGLPYAWPVSSGRAAMTMILAAMRRSCPDNDRDEVFIPAYTCYSVPAAIARAGLKPRLCDVDPSTLGMDPEALERCDFTRALAVVTANLYGLPDELLAIEALCRRRGVFMVDDAAQALGATLAGRSVGSFGDAGLYSFDKGKIISTMQGGAILARHETLIASLAASVGSLSKSPATEAIANFARLLAYSILLRPSLYGFVRHLPFTGLGQTKYETRYPITQLATFQAGVARLLFDRIEVLNDARRQRALELAEAIDGLPGLEVIRPRRHARPVFARFPLRVTAPGARNQAMRELDRSGIGATSSYPLSLADVPEVASHLPAADLQAPGAREVARTILTIPTHRYCGPDMSIRVRKVLATTLGHPKLVFQG